MLKRYSPFPWRTILVLSAIGSAIVTPLMRSALPAPQGPVLLSQPEQFKLVASDVEGQPVSYARRIAKNAGRDVYELMKISTRELCTGELTDLKCEPLQDSANIMRATFNTMGTSTTANLPPVSNPLRAGYMPSRTQGMRPLAVSRTIGKLGNCTLSETLEFDTDNVVTRCGNTEVRTAVADLSYEARHFFTAARNSFRPYPVEYRKRDYAPQNVIRMASAPQ